MCVTAALSPPRLLAAWRVEAFFFLCGILIWWPLLLLVSLCRRLPPHDQVTCKREIAQTHCSHPYDTLTCYFHTAIWIGKCQSILTQAQHSSELGVVCYRAFLFCPSTCLPVGPVSLGWPLAPPGRLVHLGQLPSQVNASRDRLEALLSSTATLATGCSSTTRSYCGAIQPEIHVPMFRMEALDAFLGIREGSSALLLPRNVPGAGNMPILHALPENNDVICLQETHGKDQFPQAVQVLVSQFRLFGTFMPNNANAGGWAILTRKNLLPDSAIITHVATCQGRDHIVIIRSGESVVVIVNVRFERDLLLGDLRERLRRISPH